jgi:hypothetical protein
MCSYYWKLFAVVLHCAYDVAVSAVVRGVADMWSYNCWKLFAGVVLQREYAVAVGAIGRGVACMCTVQLLL